MPTSAATAAAAVARLSPVSMAIRLMQTRRSSAMAGRPRGVARHARRWRREGLRRARRRRPRRRRLGARRTVAESGPRSMKPGLPSRAGEPPMVPVSPAPMTALDVGGDGASRTGAGGDDRSGQGVVAAGFECCCDGQDPLGVMPGAAIHGHDSRALRVRVPVLSRAMDRCQGFEVAPPLMSAPLRRRHRWR